jgi:hypothetical protein
MFTILIAAALAGTATAPLSAGEFLKRAEPLLNKSKAGLLFSSEARSLLKVLGETAQRRRDQLDADRAEGRPITTCLPPKGKGKIEARELISYLRALPQSRRAESFDAAFAGYAARKYPCRS